jgi:DNA polymerase-3 subunit beta
LQISPEDLRAVSTDGHRLSKFIYTEYKNEGAGYEAIVPVKALSLAAKSITDEEEVKIHSGDKYLILEYQGNLLYTRLIEGKYPLYENVIPKTNKNILVGNVEAMTSSVRRVSIFSNSISRQVKMSITAQNMVITAEDIETGGEAEEKINIDYQGEDMMVGFNASYMLDALRHIDSEEVKVLFGTPDSACIIEPLNQQDEEQFLMLLMPVRLT